MEIPSKKIISLEVPLKCVGARLDVFIASAHSDLTRSQIKILIEDSRVLVDGIVVKKASHPVSAGNKVELYISPPRDMDLTPQDLNLHIIYEDDDLAVLDKPAGISVHPSDTENKPTVVHGLLFALKNLSSVGGVARPGIVHRIDKGTSGLLVVTKTDRAHLHLSAQFKAHSVNRRYRAIVYGDLAKKAKTGTIETFFGRHPVHRKRMTGTLKEGRRAKTHWTVIESLSHNMTLIECRLETGRTHQIRVHMSELGYAVVGDPIYGNHEKRVASISKENPRLGVLLRNLNHQLLHAKTLGFVHPVTQEMMNFEAPLPLDFNGILEALQDRRND